MTNHATVLADIIATRGGDVAFSIEQRAVASALSHTLVAAGAGDASAATTIAQLSALLPPAQPKRQATDVSQWSPTDRRRLRDLLAKYDPNAPPPPERPPRSPRLLKAARLARVLDRIEARIAASDRPLHNGPTRDECHAVYCAFSPLLIDVNVTVAGLLMIAGVGARPAVNAADVVMPPIEAPRALRHQSKQ
jgi:hypothetical protein